MTTEVIYTATMDQHTVLHIIYCVLTPTYTIPGCAITILCIIMYSIRCYSICYAIVLSILPNLTHTSILCLFLHAHCRNVALAIIQSDQWEAALHHSEAAGLRHSDGQTFKRMICCSADGETTPFKRMICCSADGETTPFKRMICCSADGETTPFKRMICCSADGETTPFKRMICCSADGETTPFERMIQQMPCKHNASLSLRIYITRMCTSLSIAAMTNNEYICSASHSLM